MVLNCGVSGLLRVPWAARRSNQSVLKDINPEYSLEQLMLNQSSNPLATWCEELTRYKRPWCWERLKAGRGRDGWVVSLTRWTWVWSSSRRWGGTGKPGVLQSIGSQSCTQLSDWTKKKMLQAERWKVFTWWKPLNCLCLTKPKPVYVMKETNG